MATERVGFECGYCERTYADRPPGFLGLDLEASDGPVESHWYQGFCSTEHAAGWLARPLPEPDQVMSWTPYTRGQDWRFWLGLVGGAVLGLVTLTLAVIGAAFLVG